MNHQNEDAEFEAYLRRRSRLSHRYRELGREAPPGELDNAVLSMAREAQRIREPQAPESYMEWMAPVAFAATVVLVFSVVIQIVVRPQLVPATPVAPANEAMRSPQSVAPPVSELASTRTTEPAIRNARVQSSSAPRATTTNVASPTQVATLAAPVAAEQAPIASDETQMPVAVHEQVAARKSPGTVAPIAARPAAAFAGASGAAAADGHPSTAPRDAKTWLAEIERLRRSGQTAAAAEQLKLFRKQFPDYFSTHRSPASAE